MENIKRRKFIKIAGVGAALGGAGVFLPDWMSKVSAGMDLPEDYYRVPMQGNVRILHTTDVHGQLFPVYFREPNVNLGMGDAKGRPPHLVGAHLLEYMDIDRHTPEAYAYSYLDFDQQFKKYGRMGGFAQIKTLLDQLRQEAGGQANTLTLDGGDLWQGSATSLWTRGMDMVEASNILGVDVMVGHWEFTYREEEVLSNAAVFKGDFIGQNVKVKEEALFGDEYPALVERFDGRGLFDENAGHAFQPYVIKSVNGAKICIIGQAFPRTANANPQEFFPDWSFGLREDEMIDLVENIRAEHQPHAICLLSHNGMDVDVKMAQRVPGLDAIFGGHTHDGMPKPLKVDNVSGGTCLVTNAGSNGKFVGVMDLDIDDTGLKAAHYRMLPVFEDMLQPDPEMNAYLNQMRNKVYDENIIESRQPALYFNTSRVGRTYNDILSEQLAIAGTTLYRRGNFMGTWDQVICDALLEEYEAEIALSPGVRWGTTVPRGEWITMEDVMSQCAITYGETYVVDMSGSNLYAILEGIADNLFAPDPYLQSGGDMVRVGGLEYTMDPTKNLNERMSDLRLTNGEAFDMDRSYRVAGWASVGPAPEGRLIWDVVRDYILRQRDENQVLHVSAVSTPKLVGVSQNPGIADYIGTLG